MLWFKKKAKDEANSVEAEEKTELKTEETELTESENFEEEFFNEAEFSEETEETEETEDNNENESEIETEECIADLTVKIKSLDDMAEFMNDRRSDGMQFMKKDTLEAFELRERHLRLARVWGSVSMSRECPPEEYGKIMLALELLQSQNDYYVLPLLDEKTLKIKIQEFCEQNYGSDGKKYSKSPEKFAQLLKENDDIQEWKVFSKEAMYDLSAEFCDKNGIDFSDIEDEINE